jgi:hypothetical protein
MILPFSTKLNGKPTYFVEKIHKSFRIHEVNMKAAIDPSIHYTADYNFIAKDKLPAKLHTIREDKNDRWKPGTKIDFFINCRQKNMFRFAPVLQVVSVEEVYMSYKFNDVIEISVGEKLLFGHDERLQFAQNDGFDTWEDFFNYFYLLIKAAANNFLKMKLIHWTDLKY